MLLLEQIISGTQPALRARPHVNRGAHVLGVGGNSALLALLRTARTEHDAVDAVLIDVLEGLGVLLADEFLANGLALNVMREARHRGLGVGDGREDAGRNTQEVTCDARMAR